MLLTRERTRSAGWCCVGAGMLTALGLLAAAGCQKKTEAPSAIRPVRAMKVGDAAGFVGRWYPGRAKATQEVNLAFRVGGPLVERPVNVGDVVKEGDLLARIDPRDFEVALRDFQGRLELARANLKAMKVGARPEELEKLRADVERYEAVVKRWQFEVQRLAELDKTGAATEVEIQRTSESFAEAKAALATAREDLAIGEAGARAEDIEAKEAEIRSLEASVDAAQDQLNYTRLTAPFDGVVAATFVENFETVTPNQAIVRLLDTTKIEMVMDVPEDKISLAPYVDTVFVRFKALGDREIPATIKEIGTEASATTRTYPVTLIMDQLADATILPGMAGEARGTLKMPDETIVRGVEVPSTAVLVDSAGGAAHVWVIDASNMTVSKQPVTVGDATPRGLVVTGLTPGQWIVTAGVHYLEPGQKVRFDEAVAGSVAYTTQEGAS